MWASKMPRRKDISSDLTAAINQGVVIRSLPNYLKSIILQVRKIIHNRKTLKTVANLDSSEHPSKLTPRSDRTMLKESS